MKLVFNNADTSEFLRQLEGIIDYNHPIVQAKIEEITNLNVTTTEKVRIAFNFVRDEIDHSFDTNSSVITVSASEAMEKREGICFAKSHVLAALLRGMCIPTGFCYQRVVRKGTVESGYALHGLNAVYLEEIGDWIRLDPRGNKPGIQSAFNITKEELAYPIREALGEIDYPEVYSKPLESVIRAMNESKDCHELFYKRPESI